MDDTDIRARIETLESEERTLRSDEQDAAEHGREDKVAEDASRLEAIRGELAQLWDLLRRRQAAQDNGQDPDGAGGVRPLNTIEGYLG